MACLQEWLVKFRILKSDRREFVILDKVSGVIPPSRICLLLGPPGSGKSTLLQALAGKLDAPDLRVGTRIHRLLNSLYALPLLPIYTKDQVTSFEEINPAPLHEGQ